MIPWVAVTAITPDVTQLPPELSVDSNGALAANTSGTYSVTNYAAK
jgi:hypothetical protein